MIFDYRYKGNTAIAGNSTRTEMNFVPDALRPPVYFSGQLARQVAFREAISALHAVVVSDLRFQPKDKTAYKEWVAQNELSLLSEFGEQYEAGLSRQIDGIKTELSEIGKTRNAILGPYYKAQKKYFNYLYQKERDFWFVLDPVITVHPDELFFECFSEDESTYGKLSCSYEAFKNVGEFSCGTTNIDYSSALYNEFQKIRNYKETSFDIDPSGFEVKTEGEDNFIEEKIDVPDSWVRGFLQVSSAMTLAAVTFKLHPMDLHNICYLLRRQKEKLGPRYIQFNLIPGQPVEMVFEPWGHKVICRRSHYHGTKQETVKLWGRRRLLTLERLIPIASTFTVHLLGTGLPSFFIADLGHMQFTLGLSGWTANDWSRSGHFDLMAPRTEVDAQTKMAVMKAMQETWVASSTSIAKQTGIGKKQVESALGLFTQAGKVIYDLDKQCYRLRELSREPLPMEMLRFSSPVEAAATHLLYAQKITVQKEDVSGGKIKLESKVKDKNSIYHPQLIIDADERIVQGACQCHHYYQNKMQKGPCEHMLVLRLAYNQQHWWQKIWSNS